MININVFSNQNVDIESIEYHIETQQHMINFLTDLIEKIKYGREAICLEEATIVDSPHGMRVFYREIKRW